MTTAVNDSNPSFADALKRMDPNGTMAPIVEQLQRETPELMDASVVEGNLPTGHRITYRDALPTPTWRMANQGIPGSKSRTQQVDEQCGQLSAKSQVDPDVARLSASEQAFRMSEDKAFVASMGNEVATGIWYHNTNTNPEKFEGFGPRLASTTGLYGGQVVDSQIAASGSDQASVYWVCWGPRGAYLIFPKGQKAGLEMEDMGKQLVPDENANTYPAWVTIWKWHVGLCVEDYRQVVRVANIDTSAVSETGSLLLQDLVKGYYQVRNPNMGRLTMYCNRKIATYLASQMIFSGNTVSASNVAGGAGNIQYRNDLETGRQYMTFMGCPVRLTDQLLNTEDIIT